MSASASECLPEQTQLLQHMRDEVLMKQLAHVSQHRQPRKMKHNPYESMALWKFNHTSAWAKAYSVRDSDASTPKDWTACSLMVFRIASSFGFLMSPCMHSKKPEQSPIRLSGGRYAYNVFSNLLQIAVHGAAIENASTEHKCALQSPTPR